MANLFINKNKFLNKFQDFIFTLVKMLKTIGGKYWDINDFLCEEEKIVCKFECDSYQMSELDSN